ncbi:hypothetical protein SCHPADRAFT_409348 [Schizopora paradoxa]|uniref:Phosphatidylinositol N-acetylglucosaminyltransferase subunit H conserved domain-containing protein n=1 Tax=Schizopora paradoxa TaxID=27342 RepID=A0A0H2RM00_9AGAM|nr:hypothetical protein SCHPADRAFT_409348 [Schizopora paradoxa]
MIMTVDEQIFGFNKYAFAAATLLTIFWWNSRVAWESITVYPPNGLQLETCRGLPFFPSISRKFVPNVFIRDVLINEALHRWSARYYLALMVNPGDEYELLVAFKETLPHFPILLEVYQGVQECLKLGHIPHDIFQGRTSI